MKEMDDYANDDLDLDPALVDVLVTNKLEHLKSCLDCQGKSEKECQLCSNHLYS